MCTFEILSPRIDIVNYLVPTWHVSSTSCNLLVFGVKMMSDILVIYHRELFPNTSCLLTIGTHLCVVEIIDHLHVGVCFCFPYLLPSLCQLRLPSVPLEDLVVFLILSSVFLDIVNVVILPCAFCIQMQILYNAQLVGELSYFL